MSEDSFTEVTSESWFSRIGGAIKGIIVGVILFIVAFPVLFFNEGRAVKTYKSLKEGGGAVISVPSEKTDAGNEGKLIHVVGQASTEETITEPVFNVSTKALKLKRNVQMFQWKEEKKSKSKKKLGGGTETVTTYNYTKGWSSSLVNSSNFKKPENHENPGSFPYDSERFQAANVTLGDFTLSSSLVGKINKYSKLTLSQDKKLPKEVKNKGKIHNGGIYIGKNPSSPEIGDMKISFEEVKPTTVSIIAAQAGKSFSSYKTKAGGSIELLQTGTHNADAMIQKAQDGNKFFTWILRIAGFILMFVGLSLILKPLSVIADVLPILGDIVGAGTGIISFLIAAPLSLITIAIAWVFYRPVLGILLLVVAGGSIFLARSKMKKAKAAA